MCEYYTLLTCPECGHEHYSLWLNTIRHKWKPVFDPDMFSCLYETCDECWISFWTGDIEILSENN